MHMNWIDAVLVLIILLALWSGWQRGFFNGTLGLLTWAGSFVAAYFLYPGGAAAINHFTAALGNWTPVVAFISILIIARLLLNILASFILQQTSTDTLQHPVNRFLGLIPGFANGLLQAIIVAALLLTIPVQNRISDAARESHLATRLAPPALWLEHQLAPIFSEPLREALPAHKVEPGSNEFVKLPYTVKHATVREELEAKMLVLVNEERTKAGLKPLVADPQLQVVARAHSNDMFVRGYFAHVDPDKKDPFDRMRAAGVRFTAAGENLALAQSLQQAHEGLMKSPGHRANILQPRFGRLGIGILDGGIYGLMVTQNFRN